MKLLSKRFSSVDSRRIDTGEIVETTQSWQVEIQDAAGRVHRAIFDHDPTDDELVAAVPGAPARLRPTTLAQRVETAAELAAIWNALRDAAAAAAADVDFTAVERTRLNAARDLAKAALRAYV